MTNPLFIMRCIWNGNFLWCAANWNVIHMKTSFLMSLSSTVHGNKPWGLEGKKKSSREFNNISTGCSDTEHVNWTFTMEIRCSNVLHIGHTIYIIQVKCLMETNQEVKKFTHTVVQHRNEKYHLSKRDITVGLRKRWAKECRKQHPS